MIKFQSQLIDKCKYVVVPPRGDYNPSITPDSTHPFAPCSSPSQPPLFLPEVVTYFWLQGGDILVVIDKHHIEHQTSANEAVVAANDGPKAAGRDFEPEGR